MSLSKNIKKYRKEKGWSMHELSRRSGVSTASISRVESGKIKFTIDNVYKIAKSLGISIDKLLDFSTVDKLQQ